MQKLTSVFRDTGGLHARIATYLHHSSVLRIGLVPLVSRNRTASVLTALLDDPVQQTQWAKALASRPLSKDVLITQSAQFTHIETHNSLMVYPLPFGGPPVEYLEVNSIEDSWDHLKTCHLILQICNDKEKPKDLQWPQLIVVDSENDGNVSVEPSDLPSNAVQFSGEVIRIDSKKALRANQLLQESPKNIDEFLDLRNKSSIDSLKFDSFAVYEALKRSIWQSCESQIKECAPTKQEPTANKNTEIRQAWHKAAHQELQGEVLPQLRSVLFHELAWYKLFARSDDVYSILSSLLKTSMQESRAKFQYLMGQLAVEKINPAETETTAQQLNQLTIKLQNQSINAVLQSFGVQLPIVGVAIAGGLWGGFNWYSMSALGLLGIFSGLKKLQNKWIEYTNAYETQVNNVLVSQIRQREQQLWSAGEEGVFQASEHVKVMKAVLEEAKRDLLDTKSSVSISRTADLQINNA